MKPRNARLNFRARPDLAVKAREAASESTDGNVSAFIRQCVREEAEKILRRRETDDRKETNETAG